MAARTVGAHLSWTVNIQGSYKFLNLRTGKRLLVDVGHSTNAQSHRPCQSAGKDRQPELLTFYDRKGRLIGESETPGVSGLNRHYQSSRRRTRRLYPSCRRRRLRTRRRTLTIRRSDDGLDEGHDIVPPRRRTRSLNENPIVTLDDIDPPES
jgi:hypothetical protein